MRVKTFRETKLGFGKDQIKPFAITFQLHMNCINLRLKKGKDDFRHVPFYGRFLSKSNPTIAIAMIIAITDAAMYVIRSAVVAMFV